MMMDAARHAISFVEGYSEEQFLESMRTQHAVSMCIVVIGENARRLLTSHRALTELHPDIPWLEMAHMRDRIAHGYEKLHMRIVWETATTNLKPLLDMLEPILASLPDPDSPAIP